MSFEIKFQRTQLQPNYVNKAPADIITLSGTLRDATTVENPSIMIETSSSEIWYCNYMTIDTFGRSYFIDKRVSYRNNFVIINAHVDVLYTYRQALLQCSGIVERQANDYNLMLDDGQYRSQQNPLLSQQVFPNEMNNDNYILIMAGTQGV